MAKTGRPKIEIDQKQFEGLCAIFCTEEEIAEMLGREFAGMMMLIKSGKMEMFYIKPEKKDE